MNNDFRLRRAQPEDIDLLYELIGEFSVYEHNESMFTATKELLLENIFEKDSAEVYFPEDSEGVQGLVVLTKYFVPYVGKNTLLLELLYLRERARGRGYGKQIFKFLSRCCVEKDMPRLEWFCLRDNAPGNGFYNAMGFSPSQRLLFYRAPEEILEELRK